MMTLPARRTALLIGLCMPCATMPLAGQRTPPVPPDVRPLPAPAPRPQVYIASSSTARRVLGVGLAQRGSMRDTAGLLITSITDGGAADEAGLTEGDRIVSIDGIDLRVPADDAGNSDAVDARVSRLRRALDALKDSQPVRVDVLSEGRRRTVSVTPTRENGWNGFSFSPAQVQGMASDIRASVNRNFALSDEDRREMNRARAEGVRDRSEATRDGERETREAMRGAQRAMAEGQREMARARIEIEGSTRDGRRMWSDDDDDREEADARTERRITGRGGVLRGRTDGATLSLDGLSLASVDRDFAQQLGKGAERGALVLRTRANWEPLRAGDVILSIEGRPVRNGNALDVTIDRSRDQRLEILRSGRQQTLTLRPPR